MKEKDGDYFWKTIEAHIKAHPDMTNLEIVSSIEFKSLREGGRCYRRRAIFPTRQQVMKRISVLRKKLGMPEPKPKPKLRGRPIRRYLIDKDEV